MATEVLMPKLGLTMTEGTIAEWKVAEGQPVKKGDVLFAVETDKLTSDVECETDGTLLKILLPAGESAPLKSVIAWIGQPGEGIPDGDAAAPTASAVSLDAAPVVSTASAAPESRPAGAYVLATPYAKKLAKEKKYPLDAIPGTGPNGTVVARDVESSAAKLKTSPMAAKLAAELGVDMGKLDVAGRVMKSDVLAAAGMTAPAAEIEAEGNDLPPVKVSSLRRSIAANMSASWSTSPRVTYTHPVDATSLKELRAQLKGELKEQGIKLTYNHILMKMVAKALTEFPDINASFQDNMLTHHKHVNLGLAVVKDDGLIVPNVKSAESKSLAEIARETEALIESTRNGQIALSDLTGGTFTISSLGYYGITDFSPIINQPELAILGVCDMVDTPVVRDGQIAIRPMMNLCLTADHRVIDGVMASKFLKRVCGLLEHPYMLFI